MNNSDSPASPDEKWTAFVDGRLGAEEAAAFAREHPEAAAEKAAAAKIAQALRRHSPAPVLRNADFFNEKILREIAPVQPRAESAPARPSLWSLWRMALAGACCLLAVGAIYSVFVKNGEQHRDRYVANVLSVHAGDDLLSATVLDAEGLAVVWIDGLDQLPNDYVLE